MTILIVDYTKGGQVSILDYRISYKPFEYPKAYEYMKLQQNNFWLPSEVNMSKDIEDWNRNLTESERLIIGQILKSFVQSETHISDYWSGNVAKWFPKHEIVGMAQTFGAFECFDEETELLTSTGWVNVKDITEDMLLANYDITTRKITFEKPTKIHKYRYSGNMHHYQSKNTDIMVTPNHDLITIHPQSRKVTKRKSEKSKLGKNYLYPVSGVVEGDETISFMDRLIIALQADGSIFDACPSSVNYKRNDCCVNFKKQRKIERMDWILSNIKDIKYKRKMENGYVKYNIHLPEYIDVHSIKNLDYFDITKINSTQAQEILKEVLFWDGSKCIYYNTNKKAIDKIQAIGVLSGNMSTQIGINRKENDMVGKKRPQGGVFRQSKICYALTVSNYPYTTYPYRKEVAYDGYVYCVSVPSQNVVSRRNGKVAFTGNSIHAEGYDYLNVELGLEDYEAFLKDETAMAKLERLKEIKGDSLQDKARSLAIFSACTEGTSLFSSFVILANMSRFGYMRGVKNIIEWSQRDEMLHAVAGAWLFRTLAQEFPEVMTKEFKKDIYEAMRLTVELEDNFIDKAFSLGEMRGLDPKDIKTFIRQRANEMLLELGLKINWKNLDQESLERMSWFSQISYGINNTDFFSARVTDYAKVNWKVEDLF
jgi:ribonucleotide reductase beta subunit family protein with ferritin-like domain